MYTNEDFI